MVDIINHLKTLRTGISGVRKFSKTGQDVVYSIRRQEEVMLVRERVFIAAITLSDHRNKLVSRKKAHIT